MRHRTVTINRARAMRKNMSSAEVLLWSRLRGRSGDRPTFRRQHPIGHFIVDFYCPSARLAIEVDGSVHWDGDRQRRDEARDAWLANRGVEVMRIPASQVYGQVYSVVDGIFLRAAERKRELAQRSRLAPSTPRSSARLRQASAGGPPPAIAAAMGEVS